MDARLKQLFDYGHHLNPNPRVATDITKLEDIENLAITDVAAQNMVASWQEMMSPLQVDGELGPLTEKSLTVERCGRPDYMPAGQGTFNNPCFTDGIRFSYDDRRRPGNFSRELAEKMITNVVNANGQMGALMIRVDVGDSAQIGISWNPNLGGGSVIGLAQLTNGPCGQYLFCKINPSYARAGLVQMSALLCHEIAHNYGFNHERTGILSPTIVNLNGVFRGWQQSDPAYKVWKRHNYNGFQPITTTPGPTPGPAPEPDDPKLRFEIETTEAGISLATVFSAVTNDALGTYVAVVTDGILKQLNPWYSV